MTDLPDSDGLFDPTRSAFDRRWNLDACGITRSGSVIPALVHPDANDPAALAALRQSLHETRVDALHNEVVDTAVRVAAGPSCGVYVCIYDR